MNQNIRIQFSLIVYLIFISIIILIKPKHIYNKDKSLKQFGSGQNKTIFPLWLLIFLGAFLSYYITHILTFIFYSR